MINHNELLDRISQRLNNVKQDNTSQKIEEVLISTNEEESTTEILNKIGLEVQRQGGY